MKQGQQCLPLHCIPSNLTVTACQWQIKQYMMSNKGIMMVFQPFLDGKRSLEVVFLLFHFFLSKVVVYVVIGRRVALTVTVEFETILLLIYMLGGYACLHLLLVLRSRNLLSFLLNADSCIHPALFHYFSIWLWQLLDGCLDKMLQFKFSFYPLGFFDAIFYRILHILAYLCFLNLISEGFNYFSGY